MLLTDRFASSTVGCSLDRGTLGVSCPYLLRARGLLQHRRPGQGLSVCTREPSAILCDAGAFLELFYEVEQLALY